MDLLLEVIAQLDKSNEDGYKNVIKNKSKELGNVIKQMFKADKYLDMDKYLISALRHIVLDSQSPAKTGIFGDDFMLEVINFDLMMNDNKYSKEVRDLAKKALGISKELQNMHEEDARLRRSETSVPIPDPYNQRLKSV